MGEDKELYKEFLNGNDKALEKLLIKYKNNLIYFISRYVRDIDAAEDIVQEVFLYLLEKKEKYKFNYSFKTYIYIIARSRTLDYIKKQRFMKTIEGKEISDKEQLLEEIIFSNDRKNKIINVMKKMSNIYQLAIYLTQIEGISYRETAQIMNKSENQIKILVHRARKKLKQLLIEEKIIEIKNNRMIKLLTTFIIISILITGVVYASIKIYEKGKGQAKLTPTFTETIKNTDINSIWVGSFQLAWNEFLEKVIGGDVEFEDGKSNLVEELNKKEFTKDMISENFYYIKVEKTSQKLKDVIYADINKKFNINNSFILNEINFESTENSYTLYSLLFKNFTFITPFDRLGKDKFGNYQEEVEYFGINNASDENLNKNIEVLFYKNKTDFSVKLNTRGNDEIILYKTNSKKSFSHLYQEILERNNEFKGEKNFVKDDELKIPFININTIINYNDLCGHFIKGTNGMYISNALQNVKFSLNERGGNLISEAVVKSEYLLDNEYARYFYFDDNFILFIKEKDRELPYFALKIENLDILT